MYKPKPLAKAVSLAIATSTLSISPQVLAQDEDVAEDRDTIEEIITTGSRIRRDGFSSAAPIDVVLTENAVVSGISNLGDMMQSTTVAAGAPDGCRPIGAPISAAAAQKGSK